MTKLEGLKVARDAAKVAWHAADDARDAVYVNAYASDEDWDAVGEGYHAAYGDYNTAENAYSDELKKTQEETSDD